MIVAARPRTDEDLPHEALAPLEPLWDAQAARAADRWTIESVGLPGLVLMDQAGRFVADAAERMAKGGPVVVLAGPGNNGGDGWVAARHLCARGVPTAVLALRPPGELQGDARAAAEAFTRAASALSWRAFDGGEPWRPLSSGEDLRALLLSSPALVVDALFGTGLGRPLEGLAAEVVETLSALDFPVLAVDLPSGLPTDGEAPSGPCLRATATITFDGRKIAHATEPGRLYCGEVTSVDIGILRNEELRSSARVFAAPPLASLRLPLPRLDAHKGAFGHVGILEGSAETAGASRLSAHAALRAGAGLVTLLVDDITRESAGNAPEVMRRGFPLEQAERALVGLSALVVGPGLGRDSRAQAKGRALLAAAAARQLPVVVDADALPLLLEAELANSLAAIATPHPGEAATLLGRTSADVQRDRHGAVDALIARAPRAVWLLKGACPIVGTRARHVVVEGGALPLAVGGSGDTLAGVLGALAARGLPLESCAIAGAVVHQEAGARLARKQRRGHTAREIADACARVLEEVWAA